MPKSKTSRHELATKWICDTDDAKNYVIVDDGIQCLYCNLMLYPTKRIDFYRHLKSKSHQDNKNNTCSTTSRDFNYKLTKAFLLSDIPLSKLGNPHLIEFLEEACKKKIPHHSTLRHYYIDKVFLKTMNTSKMDIGNNYVYIIVDEAMDACGRHICNFLIGVLNGTPTKCHLIATKEISNTKHETIVEFVQNCLEKCKMVDSKKILVLVTDAAAYMLEAGKRLKQLFPQLIHVTCLAQSLNRVAEQVKGENPNVNRLIEVVRTVFLKAPSRVAKFRELQPDVPLPPEPIDACWGTWLKAATYYAENFDAIKMVVSSLDPDEATCIAEVGTVLNIPTIKDDLQKIRSFTIISDSMKQLETANLPLKTSLQLITKVEVWLGEDFPGCGYAKNISKKLKSVLEKNPGYSVLKSINNYTNKCCETPPIEPNLINCFKYCPVTVVDVEKSFLAYKEILSDRQHRFTEESLEKLLIVYFENNYGRY